jgi:2-keto-3-deoxy-L-rhamnonate aldolase RhmA
MRLVLAACLLVAAGLAASSTTAVAQGDRLNPIIALQEKGLPVFGIAHPAISAGRGRGAAADPAAAPPPAIVLSDVAKETVGYKRADYLFTSGPNEAGFDNFVRYTEELKKAGGSARTLPFAAKIGIWHGNPADVTARIQRQLNAGHSSVSMEAVESAQEVRDVIKAMRLVSAGGTRPETGLEHAAAYWGLTVDQYKKKADVWPINKSGELLISVIVESREGLAKVREIAAEPGVGQMFAGYGTLGSVFQGDPEGREAAAQQILAACKEYKIPCGFPVNNPAEMEQRMKEGWSVFIMQRRNDAAFGAVETGRKMSGR